jgi:hypothetical protein
VVALAGLLLGGCGRIAPGPATSAARNLTAAASVDISVPLTHVACTTTDICVAVGATGLDSGATSAAQFVTPRHGWQGLAIDPIASGTITQITCGTQRCLVAGTDPTGNFLMNWTVGSDHIARVTYPSNLGALRSLACSASPTGDVCTAVSDTQPPVIAISTDGGTQWTMTTLLSSWLRAPALSLLDAHCSPSLCLGIARLSSGALLSDVVTAANTPTGATRSLVSTIARHSATLLSSRCTSLSPARCVVRWREAGHLNQATIGGSSHRPSRVTLPLDGPLACTERGHCVAISRGQLTVSDGSQPSSVSVSYLPDALVAVACGSQHCAAVSPSAALYFRP